jgi:hypothetical protein
VRHYRRVAVGTLAALTVTALTACGSPGDPAASCAAGIACAASDAWPGADDAHTVDAAGVLGVNVSGLTYEAQGGTPAVLWAVRNDPGTLMRLVAAGTVWAPDPTGGWASGRALRYPDNSGNPDAEGLTLAAGGVADGVYVVAERDNERSGASRNSILRYDPTQATTVLRATQEWDLTTDLPGSGANLGLEAITWVPDSMLVANGFRDESTGRAYAPANYANHGSGVFVVGLESDGNLYAYVLNHTSGVARRVATIVTGFTAVMGMEYDRDTGALWILCDNHCRNALGVLTIGSSASRAPGTFLLAATYAKPASMPDVNNEGFAIAPPSTCVGNRKPAFWADDDATGGHVLRSAGMPCTITPAP